MASRQVGKIDLLVNMLVGRLVGWLARHRACVELRVWSLRSRIKGIRFGDRKEEAPVTEPFAKALFDVDRAWGEGLTRVRGEDG